MALLRKNSRMKLYYQDIKEVSNMVSPGSLRCCQVISAVQYNNKVDDRVKKSTKEKSNAGSNLQATKVDCIDSEMAQMIEWSYSREGY